ncbi:MAG: hypothetical protein E6H90_09445 [Chloroflexi bacterium]|nr:MAG: hypothetical protein E6H90_09445 [Chloroflexota bacterium]
MRSAVATRRQFLTVGGVALAGAVLSRSVVSEMVKLPSALGFASPSRGGQGGGSSSPSPSPSASPSPSGGGQGGGSVAATPTPAPTPATVTIPVPVIQQSMVLDCETAALQQGLAYYGINVGQPQLIAQQNADVRLPAMGSNHSVLRWGNPYKNFVGYVNGSDWIPTGYGVYWPVILDLARNYGLPNAIGGEGFAPSAIYSALAAGQPVQVWVETRFARVALATWTAWDGTAVRYSYAEHSLTLTGVSPTQVRVNDVLDASQYWVSKSLFEANFADFNNMAVIFR